MKRVFNMQKDTIAKNRVTVSSEDSPLLSDARYRILLAGMIALLIFVVLLSVAVGRYGMSIWESVRILFSPIFPVKQNWTATMSNVVFNIRLPRTLAALLIGGSLALAGASYQSMFKNPMVSPDLLGVTHGASAGASAAILLTLSPVMIQVWALVGGFAAVIIATMVPRLMKNTSPTMLVLSGIIVRELMISALGIVRYLAAGSGNEAIMASITYWTMGSLSKITMESLGSVVIPLVAAAAVLMLVRYRLNILSLGDNEAKSLGMDPARMQLLIVICATVLTACSSSIAGSISWVGLVVPHLGRMLVGPDNSRLLPISYTLGAIFMIIIDIIARTFSSLELPITIITGIIGAPFFFYLLYKQRMKMQ